MEMELITSGKVKLSRKEVIKIVSDYIAKENQLAIERGVCLDKDNKPCAFEQIVLFVRQAKTPAKSKPITKAFDGKKEKLVKRGFSRPNYGIGKRLREILDDKKEHHLNDILKQVKVNYPKVEPKQLRQFLMRPEMVGMVVEDKDKELYLKVE